MSPIRRVQAWTVALLVGLVAAAVLARVADDLWPGLRATSFAYFAGPGVALVFVLLLLARRRLVARAKGGVRDHLGGPAT
ncbi:MAG: hypothetical protein ACAI25_09725 [Planctomycetota bacterium]